MTKFVSFDLRDFKITKPAKHWFNASSGEVIINPEVIKLFESGKVKHWSIETNYIPPKIYMEIDE